MLPTDSVEGPNNLELTKRLVAVWRKSLGANNAEATDPAMGGEDWRAAAECTVEQVRAGARADNSLGYNRDDQRSARIDDEIAR